MKKKLRITILLFGVLLMLSSTKHPLKLTSSEIKYNAKSGSLQMECKVFVDDFAPAVSKTLFKSINTSNLSEADKKSIESYFSVKYKISINGKSLPLKFESYSVEYNVMSIKFSKNYITLKKGDKIYIANELLFEEFGLMQSNWVTLRIPPFLSNYNFECKFEKFTYSHTF